MPRICIGCAMMLHATRFNTPILGCGTPSFSQRDEIPTPSTANATQVSALGNLNPIGPACSVHRTFERANSDDSGIIRWQQALNAYHHSPRMVMEEVYISQSN